MPAFLSLDYDDQDPKSYAGISLRMGPGSRTEVFNTGNPTIDYLTATLVVMHRQGEDALMFGSSSLDHFVMDGGTLNSKDPSEAEVAAAVANAKAYLQIDRTASAIALRDAGAPPEVTEALSLGFDPYEDE